MKISRSTDYRINPMIPHPGDRPECKTRGCKSTVAITTTKKDGSPYYRATGLCGTCHGKAIAKKYGVKHANEITAKRQGFADLNEYRNSTHPYRKHRKTYCENKDGRLGHKCRATIHLDAQLEVDNINGNPEDNRPRNLQTLCANCHKFKTHANKDYATPGRKTLKRKRTK